jgi:hypothetical protein
MDTPEALLTFVKEAIVATQNTDVDSATKLAYSRWRKHPDYETHRDAMIEEFVRSVVCDQRHATNKNLRRDAGDFGGGAKVSLSTGAVNRVMEQCLLDTYVINGKRLGDILGSELPEFAKAERERASGHAVNAALCERLQPLVGKEKSVRECVKDRKAWQILREVKSPKRGRAA